jgi:hypothetical protein
LTPDVFEEFAFKHYDNNNPGLAGPLNQRLNVATNVKRAG